MISIKEDSLQQALQATGLRGLPKASSPTSKEIWLKGIALVSKFKGIKNYCLVDNNNGRPHLTRDFGPALHIISIDEIYPYEVLDKKNIPDLRSPEEIVKYLVSNGYQAEEIRNLLSKDGKSSDEVKKDKDIVKNYITIAAIKNAKIMAKERERCEKLRNFKDRIKNGEEED